MIRVESGEATSDGEAITRHVIKIDPENPDATEIVFCGYHRTDGGNAKRLIAIFGDAIRYCDELKTWFIWDGVKWSPDTTLKIQEYAKETAQRIHAEVAIMTLEGATKAAREAVSKWAFSSEEQRRINAMIRNAQSDPRISKKASDFDAKLMLINCINGTLDLEKREFREHRREDLLTNVTRGRYDPTQPSALFFPTLFKALTPGEVVYAQRMLGSFLEPTTQNKEWLFVYGKPFALKSSVTQAVYAALGDYAKAFPIELLIKSRHGVASNAARPEIMGLQGVRIAWTEEAPPNFVIDESMLKSLTSSGVKDTRGLYETQRNIELLCSFVIESNGTFNIDIEDAWSRDAALDRTHVIKFINSIPPEERDPHKLMSLTHDEAELSAALSWVIQGYFDRQDFGLETPEAINETKAEFEVIINPLASFVKNEIEFDPEGWVLVKDLWARFQEVSSAEVLKSFKGSRSFNVQLKKVLPYYAKMAGVEVKTDRIRTGATAWLNMRLIDKEDYAEAFDDTPYNEVMKQTRNDEAKGSFGEKSSHVVGYYRGLHQNGVLLHQPTFPTLLVEGLKPVDLSFFNSEGSSGEIRNDEAKLQEVQEVEQVDNIERQSEILAPAHIANKKENDERSEDKTLFSSGNSSPVLTPQDEIIIEIKDVLNGFKHARSQPLDATTDSFIFALSETIKIKHTELEEYDIETLYRRLLENDKEIQGLIVDLARGRKITHEKSELEHDLDEFIDEM